MKIGFTVMGVTAGVLAILGVVLMLLPAPAATFGWFAYQPVGDFGFVGGMPLVPATRIWGGVLLGLAVAIGAFTAGWFLGASRGRPKEALEEEQHEPARCRSR